MARNLPLLSTTARTSVSKSRTRSHKRARIRSRYHAKTRTPKRIQTATPTTPISVARMVRELPVSTKTVSAVLTRPKFFIPSTRPVSSASRIGVPVLRGVISLLAAIYGRVNSMLSLTWLGSRIHLQ
ncbi:hypothetical protein AX774_g6746 [Zancudomyces culisetae]|uniref:Uncharacterized protein n=1 Tax=Zancudomyces culisetae TaxID=1213189 RepID=A0A1R1PFP9_ZANCU|nr:hypothetical protein AX774_g6746 [Zancudomyces culisetae]|eukprot:OMH79830.1 hypothetical protein AX774_g6746 [Zancudomyces culisetae]